MNASTTTPETLPTHADLESQVSSFNQELAHLHEKIRRSGEAIATLELTYPEAKKMLLEYRLLLKDMPVDIGLTSSSESDAWRDHALEKGTFFLQKSEHLSRLLSTLRASYQQAKDSMIGYKEAKVELKHVLEHPSIFDRIRRVIEREPREEKRVSDSYVRLKTDVGGFAQEKKNLQNFLEQKHSFGAPERETTFAIIEEMARAFRNSAETYFSMARILTRRQEMKEAARKMTKTLAGAREALRSISGEKLSFASRERAGTIEHTKNMKQGLELRAGQVSGILKETEIAAFEAWKRENPAEWEKMEKVRTGKEKLAKLRDAEGIYRLALEHEGTEVFTLAQKALRRMGANEYLMLKAIFDPREDFSAVRRYIDSQVNNSVESVRDFIRKYLYRVHESLQETFVDMIVEKATTRHSVYSTWSGRYFEDTYCCELVCIAVATGGAHPSSPDIGVNFYGQLPSHLRRKLFVGAYLSEESFRSVASQHGLRGRSIDFLLGVERVETSK